MKYISKYLNEKKEMSSRDKKELKKYLNRLDDVLRIKIKQYNKNKKDGDKDNESHE